MRKRRTGWRFKDGATPVPDAVSEATAALIRQTRSARERILEMLGGDLSRLAIHIYPGGHERFVLDGVEMVELGPLRTETVLDGERSLFRTWREVRWLRGTPPPRGPNEAAGPSPAAKGR